MSDSYAKLTGAIRYLLSLLVIIFTTHAAANECLNLFPYDTVEDGLPKICQSAFNGMPSDYSCQDYRSGENRYRVLYKGGRTPKAVLALTSNGSEQLISSPLFGNQKLKCPLKAPVGVPKYATHRGIGICRDENDKPVACSIFLYAAARDINLHSYMVFYPKHKREKVRVDVSDAGKNENAMAAEIAFQIGMTLWETECCHEQAVPYLAYAYRAEQNRL